MHKNLVRFPGVLIVSSILPALHPSCRGICEYMSVCVCKIRFLLSSFQFHQKRATFSVILMLLLELLFQMPKNEILKCMQRCRQHFYFELLTSSSSSSLTTSTQNLRFFWNLFFAISLYFVARTTEYSQQNLLFYIAKGSPAVLSWWW